MRQDLQCGAEPCSPICGVGRRGTLRAFGSARLLPASGRSVPSSQRQLLDFSHSGRYLTRTPTERRIRKWPSHGAAEKSAARSAKPDETDASDSCVRRSEFFSDVGNFATYEARAA